MTRTLSFIALLLMASPAAAQNFQSTTLIDKAVAGFTGHAIGESGGARTAVDTRLKLTTCPMVSLNWRTDSHDSVVVTCTDPQWRIFVPVMMPARPAPAATPAAAPVAAAKAAIVIKRGDPVTVVAGDGGFSVTRDGIATTDAAAGARVLIRVQDGKPPIQAIAVEPGKAMIPGAE
ncbi:flagella basal body P-ring formation protein FlgA [Sphingomonas mali]|uniref:flagella basal body P-ring formation protein FlgA n=1 Tax=Sphingomonas mali TaxID=40682 RepID=UPI0008372F47|nr:flagella basal body P-ring formation protein FlgA [Sphingomonas mali]